MSEVKKTLKNLGEVTYFRLNNEINRPVDGKIPLHKDQEALAAFYKENVEPCTMQFPSLDAKLKYLVDENYIKKEILEIYSNKFKNKLFEFIKSQNFQFQSFMAAYKFYQQYALKTNNHEYYLEGPEERVFFNALTMANGDEQLATDIANELINMRYQPATPTYLNAGRARSGELVSCYLLDVTDNMNSIGRSINSALQLSRLGGGVGISLTNLREAGAPIKGYEGAASGVVPVMKLFEDSFSYSNQLGQRNGAGAIYLNVFHPDILEFLSTKKENADEKIRVKTLSLGLVVPDKFYQLARENKEMYLFSPYSVEKEYDIPFAYIDITKEYDNLVNNPRITKKKINARELEQEISKLQQESGYPFVINIDTANKANPAGGRIIMSNLCSEILQRHTPTILNNDQSYEIMGEDISCNLGSINITNAMNSKDLGRTIRTATRALTYVTDVSNVDTVPTVYRGNESSHSIGLGMMGLHSYLAMNHIEYGSSESIEFMSVYAMLQNYWTLVESNNIAKEREQKFARYEDSSYADGTYFTKYLTNDYTPKSDIVKKLFQNHFVPTTEDWKKLRDEVAKHGVYHAYRQAVAPNGSISYINDCSASIHPIIQRIEERQEKKIGKIYYPSRGLNTDTIPYYTSAYDMDMRKLIDIYAAATEHVDQGLSLTLFLRSEIPTGIYEWKGDDTKQTTRDLSILRNYAFNKGIKSLYYIRTFTDDGEEVGSNQCESCSI